MPMGIRNSGPQVEAVGRLQYSKVSLGWVPKPIGGILEDPIAKNSTSAGDNPVWLVSEVTEKQKIFIINTCFRNIIHYLTRNGYQSTLFALAYTKKCVGYLGESYEISKWEAILTFLGNFGNTV